MDLVYFADSTDDCPTIWPYDRVQDRHGAGHGLTGEQMVQLVLDAMQHCDPVWFATNVSGPHSSRTGTATPIDDAALHAPAGAADTTLDPEDLNRMSAELGAQMRRAAGDLADAAAAHEQPAPSPVDPTTRALRDRFPTPPGSDDQTWADACRVASAVAARLAAADDPDVRLFLIDAGLSREHDPADHDAHTQSRKRFLLQDAIRVAPPRQAQPGATFSNLVAHALASAL